MTPQKKTSVENILKKGENDGYQKCLPFSLNVLHMLRWNKSYKLFFIQKPTTRKLILSSG